MSEPTEPTTTTDKPGPELPPTPKPPRIPWRQWSLAQRSMVIGVSVVAVLGIAGTITASSIAAYNYDEWYEADAQLAEQLATNDSLETRVGNLNTELSSAEADLEPQEALARLEATLSDREAKVAARESDVTARENAATMLEQRIQATSLTGGKYTVGVSMEAGTYRTDNTSERCYWAVYTSGTNYDDIVQNDLGSVGVLTVTVSEGQDFETNRCGTWTKIG